MVNESSNCSSDFPLSARHNMLVFTFLLMQIQSVDSARNVDANSLAIR